MRKPLVAILFCFCSSLLAQDYAVQNISEEMREDADAVVRADHGSFKILSIDKAEYAIKHAVTILNQRANDQASVVLGYDKLTSISEIVVTVYDANGKKIKKVRPSEITDRSAYTGNLFDDARIKYVNVEQSDFPYTVEYSYKKKYKFLYSIPSWFFIGNENTSVESSSYTLEYPIDVGARYREYNFSGDKRVSEQNETKTLIWEMNNIPVFEFEKYGASYEESLPNLQFGVAKFSYEGYEGDMSTWSGMAAWQRTLNRGRENLSAAQVQEIKELTNGLDRLEKVKAVYNYVQENTRYVSIQLGVGGFQPFPASVVEENGYGDCKALSFYTQSLLRYLDIDSYYSWVYGGVNPPSVNADFPQDKFNHIILAVPHENDTIWLECTSQTNPFGYLGMNTGDRKALLINENGGHLVNTTSYPEVGNTQSMDVSVLVDKDGHAKIKSNTSYKGVMANNMLHRAEWSYDDQKKYIENKLDIPTFEINDFKITKEEQDVTRQLDLKVNKLLSKSGNRLFVQPNVMNKNYFVPVRYKERQTDILVRHGFHEYDTVNFEFPQGFRIEAKFDPIIIKSEFGEYEASILANEDGKFQYIRHFVQRKGRFSAEKYSEYLNFHKRVVRADKRKIALISGT